VVNHRHMNALCRHGGKAILTPATIWSRQGEKLSGATTHKVSKARLLTKRSGVRILFGAINRPFGWRRIGMNMLEIANTAQNHFSPAGRDDNPGCPTLACSARFGGVFSESLAEGARLVNGGGGDTDHIAGYRPGSLKHPERRLDVLKVQATEKVHAQTRLIRWKTFIESPCPPAATPGICVWYIDVRHHLRWRLVTQCFMHSLAKSGR
jgi:hypothetical protein